MIRVFSGVVLDARRGEPEIGREGAGGEERGGVTQQGWGVWQKAGDGNKEGLAAGYAPKTPAQTFAVRDEIERTISFSYDRASALRLPGMIIPHVFALVRSPPGSEFMLLFAVVAVTAAVFIHSHFVRFSFCDVRTLRFFCCCCCCCCCRRCCCVVAVSGGSLRVRSSVGEGGDERRGDAEDQAHRPTDVFTGDGG